MNVQILKRRMNMERRTMLLSAALFILALSSSTANAFPRPASPGAIIYDGISSIALKTDQVIVAGGKTATSVPFDLIYVNKHAATDTAFFAGTVRSEVPGFSGTEANTIIMAASQRIGKVEVGVRMDRLDVNFYGFFKLHDVTYTEDININAFFPFQFTIINRDGTQTYGAMIPLSKKLFTNYKYSEHKFTAGANYEINKNFELGASNDDGRWNLQIWLTKKPFAVSLDALDLTQKTASKPQLVLWVWYDM